MQKGLIENVDYYVRVVHFPNRSTPAQVWVNDDGTFDIYVDDLAADINAAVAHELTHIGNGHFYDDIRPVANLEEEARHGTKPHLTPQERVYLHRGEITPPNTETRVHGNLARI